MVGLLVALFMLSAALPKLATGWLDTSTQANAALVALLAKTLKRPKSSVRIVAGETARLKMIEIDGLDEPAAHAVLGPPPSA